jgi:hypothetical protein
MTHDSEQLTEDAQVFGVDAWVYCMDHVKPHQTGWCRVGVSHKLGLGAFSGSHSEQAQKALDKCRLFNLPIYSDMQNMP